MSIDMINHVVVVGLKWLVLSLVVMVLVERSRNASARVLHGVLLFTLLSLLLLPVMSIYGPQWFVPVLPEPFGAWLSLSLVSSTDAVHPLTLVLGLWMAISLLLLARLARDIVQAYCLLHRSQAVKSDYAMQAVQYFCGVLKLRRSVVLYCSDEIDTPITLGGLFPVIVLPASHLGWPNDRTRRFLLHELAHIQRHDWLQKMCGQTVTALLWFIPSAWWFQKKAQWYAELACDDTVITMGESRHDYAQDLLALSEEVRRPLRGGVALIDGSSDFRRVDALLDSSRVREEPRRKYWLYVSVLLGLSFTIASVKLGVKAPLVADIRPILIVASLVTPEAAGTGKCDNDSCISAVAPLNRQWLESPVQPQTLRFPRSPSLEATITPSLSDIVADEIIDPSPVVLVFQFDQLARTVSVVPEYPPNALRRQIEGRVSVKFDVFADGSTGNITIVERTHKSIFDTAVIAAVQKFQYRPFGQYKQERSKSVIETFEFQIIEDAKTTRE